MNNEPTLVSQVQTASIVNKTNTTRATDETPKNANIFMTYAVIDEGGESYLLGHRQMASKSVQHNRYTKTERLQNTDGIPVLVITHDAVRRPR